MYSVEGGGLGGCVGVGLTFFLATGAGSDGALAVS